MVQEDLAISPCGLYKSYFLLLIWVVNCCQIANNKKLEQISTIRLRVRKNGSQKGVFRLPFRHHSHQKEMIKNMRDEKRESDKEKSKKFVNCVIMVKGDLVDQEEEGGGLLAYPENVLFEE